MRLGYVAALCGLFAACGGGGSDAPVIASGAEGVEATFDKRGGTLQLRGSARVDIPENALERPTTIRAEKGDLGALPRVGGDFEVVGEPLIVTPHGLRLERDATIEQVITDPRSDASELRVLRLDDEEDESWSPLGELEVLEPGERRPEARDLGDQDTLTDLRRVAFRVEGFSIFLPVRLAPTPDGACIDREAGFVCRAAAGPCDVAEECDGDSPDCPADEVLGTDEVCREADGACDMAETCDGRNAACPADEVLGSGTVCRPAEDACDVAEACNGEDPSCPADALAQAGSECRPAEGACDVAETCSGESAACPTDGFAPQGVECAAAESCMQAAVCTGAAASCPAPLPQAQGTDCEDGDFCTDGDICDGAGTCVAGADPCAANLGDDDADCSEACVEISGGFECTGQDADGSRCVLSPCSLSTCSAGTCTQDAPCPIYVNAASGIDEDGCGGSWATACASVQRGSDEALASGNPRVFVAVGRYQTSGSGSVLAMADDTEYYGSFSGSEDAPEERGSFDYDAGVPPDPAVHTVLGGNGSPEAVVIGANGARLDGFSVMDFDGGAGLDSGVPSGDGMENRGGRDGGSLPLTGLTVANARFHGTSAGGGAGRGMFNEGVSDLRVENVLFDHNAQGTGDSPTGSGMHVDGGTGVTISDTRFIDNVIYAAGPTQAVGAGLAVSNVDGLDLQRVDFRGNFTFSELIAVGGAMYSNGSTQSLVDVSFDQNGVQGSSYAAGGALADLDSQSTLTDVSFTDNFASATLSAAGGAYLIEANAPVTTTLTNVVFSGNSARSASYAYGGAIEVYDNSEEPAEINLRCDGCRFEGNRAEGMSVGGALDLTGGAIDLALSNTIVADNRATYGGGLYAYGAAVTLEDSSVVGNVAGHEGDAFAGGGGVRIEDGTLLISGSQFTSNTAASTNAEGGESLGGGLYASDTAVTLLDSDFVQNFANFASGSAQGGGVYHTGALPLTVANVGFVANQAGASYFSGSGTGGAIYVNMGGGSYTITNATFVDNSDGLFVNAGSGEVHNSVFANAGDQNLVGVAPTTSHLCTTTPEDPRVSDVALGDPATGLTRTRSGHVYLPSSSPCIDAGDDALADAAFRVDWTTLTTRLDGTLDTSPVDAGRHYEPAELEILELALDGSDDITYEVRAPSGSSCVVRNAGDLEGTQYLLDPVAQPTGTLVDHGLDFAETGVEMRCETPALGKAAVSFLGGPAGLVFN